MRMTKYIPPAIELWKEHPLFGTGPWSYRNQVYEAQARIAKRDKKYFKNYRDPKPRRVHNEYIEMLVDFGLIGWTIHAVFAWMTLREGIRKGEIELVCLLIAILVNAVFFFPFRLQITLFETSVIGGMIWVKE